LELAHLIYEVAEGKGLERIIRLADNMEELDDLMFKRINQLYEWDYLNTIEVMRHILVYNAYQGESSEMALLKGWNNLLMERGVI
jgi:hypothetical protein